jgi:hypothetical protein
MMIQIARFEPPRTGSAGFHGRAVSNVEIENATMSSKTIPRCRIVAGGTTR